MPYRSTSASASPVACWTKTPGRCPKTLVEIWQANAAGRYAHAGDVHDAPLDPDFTGAGRTPTDAEGRSRFTTVRPGAYGETGYWRVKVSVPSSTAGAWHDSLVVHVPSRVVWLKDVTVTAIAQSALPK